MTGNGVLPVLHMVLEENKEMMIQSCGLPTRQSGTDETVIHSDWKPRARSW